MKVLFVSDNEDDWTFFNNLFKAHFRKIQLTCVAKGNEALETLTYQGPFAFFMIDCDVKSFLPTDLVSHMRELVGERPVLFLGSQSLIQQRVLKDVYEEKATEKILYRPVDPPKFKLLVQEIVEWIEDEEADKAIQEGDEADYLPLKIKNFYLYKEVPYDVFTKITKNKYMKVIGRGQSYTEAKIQGFIKKKIKFLYLHKTNHLEFLENSVEEAERLLARKDFSLQRELMNQQAACSTVHQYIWSIGMSENIQHLTRILIEKIGATFEKSNSLKEITAKFPYQSGDLSEKSLMSAYFCEAILLGMRWNADISRKKLGLAAILHDSSLPKEDMSLIDSMSDEELNKYSEEEQEAFKGHPLRAGELANLFTDVPEADFIVAQHHELPNGQGFPNKLNSHQITSLSATFIMANNFVRHFLAEKPTKSRVLETFNRFEGLYDTGNFKEPLKILKKAFSA